MSLAGKLMKRCMIRLRFTLIIISHTALSIPSGDPDTVVSRISAFRGTSSRFCMLTLHRVLALMKFITTPRLPSTLPQRSAGSPMTICLAAGHPFTTVYHRVGGAGGTDSRGGRDGVP